MQAPEGDNKEEILECPDHRTSSFLKGKPRSILSLLCFENDYFEYLYMFDALSDRNWMQTLVAYISIPCLVNIPESYLGPGANQSLALLRSVKVR